LLQHFTVLRSALKRPSDVPESWILLNAPRPLLGQKTWEGEWGHGRHWAALDPDDDYTPMFLRKSLELDGWVVEFVGQDDFDRHAIQLCAEHGYDVEDFDDDERRRSYFTSHERMEVAIPSKGE
jgi:hypothetical protein